MRKIVTILLLICTLTLCLASCGNNSSRDTNDENTYTPPEKTAVEKTEDLISYIKDADTCYVAAKSFYALSEEEQSTVYNSYDLKDHMETYSSDTRIRDYLMEDAAAAKSNSFHNRLRNKLLNINSYTVNSQTTVVFYDETTNNYYLYIKIDYSAQNKAGGYTRYENNADYFVWENNSWRTLPYSSDADIALVKKIYTWEFDEYTRYSFKYKAE